MANTASKIVNFLLLLYLAFFPFGQVAAFNIYDYEIHFADLIVLVIAVIQFIRQKGRVFKYFNSFVIYIIFSYVFSLLIFEFHSFLGLLYLGRLVAYFILFDAVLTQIRKSSIISRKIFDYLIYFGTLTAIIGLIQYMFLPDLRFLHDLGWDRHHGRLAGLFLDPAFIGLIFVLNILLITKTYYSHKKFRYLLALLINIIALLLTFSRASYLAFILGSLYLIKDKIKPNKILLLIGLFVLSLNFLPKFHSEGTNLLRTYSITARFDDYSSAFRVIKNSPVIGVGYNNICEYKVRLNEDVVYSHTCSGFDSSLLLLIASTGIIGTLLFLYSFIKITQNIHIDKMDIAIASYTAVFVHSLFSNSMFYPWILGWMFFLLPSAMIKEKS